MKENHSISLPVIREPAGRHISAAEAAEAVAQACPPEDYRGKRVLVIVPDGTRTAPIGLVFKALFAHLGGVTQKLDVLIALGTHQPMSEAAICGRLEISLEERRGVYGKVAFHNHAWDQSGGLAGDRRDPGGGNQPVDRRLVLDGCAGGNQPAGVSSMIRSSSLGRFFRMKWSVFPAATNTFSPAWAGRAF